VAGPPTHRGRNIKQRGAFGREKRTEKKEKKFRCRNASKTTDEGRRIHS